jgi:hypothetical protein
MEAYRPFDAECDYMQPPVSTLDDTSQPPLVAGPGSDATEVAISTAVLTTSTLSVDREDVEVDLVVVPVRVTLCFGVAMMCSSYLGDLKHRTNKLYHTGDGQR